MSNFQLKRQIQLSDKISGFQHWYEGKHKLILIYLKVNQRILKIN